MQIDLKVMDAALKAGMGGARITRLPKLDAKEVEWIQHYIPIPGFKEYLLNNAFAKECQFCAHNLYSVKLMIEANTDDYFPGVTKRYLIIGSAPNGDSIAVDKKGYSKIGFIGHEDPDNWSFIGVDTSISDFFWKSWNEDGYPFDFYQAQDYCETRKKA